MAESRFLAGKVIKTSLPQVKVPSGPNAPLLKRLLLPQGELAQFYDAADGIRYMAMIELRRDCVRGNHYHKVKEELVYVIQGQVNLVVQDIGLQSHESITLEVGDLAIIQTGIAHAMRTLEPGWAIEFSKARFDLADIHKFPLI